MGENFEGFVPIHTIFYAVFHPTEGTKVRYEFPPGNLESYDINFDTIKNFIIPKPQLCHKLLTLKYRNYRIASYPVTVNSSFYARNFFSFNFVFVFQYDCETSPYEPAIARLGKMFKVLEEQNQILSKAERDPVYFDFKSAESSGDQEGKKNSDLASKTNNQGRISEKYNQIIDDLHNTESKFSINDLVMRVYQDLNNYSECLIPIDDGNAVDIRIFPVKTPPNSSISIEDVPISTVNLSGLIDVNWDPTMLKIVPFIDGLNSIAKISKLSDSDSHLVVECIKHLIYYNCVILSDVFQFSNIYAPTSQLRLFLTDSTLSTECQSYVTFDEHSNLLSLPFSVHKRPKIEKREDSFQNKRDEHSRGTSESSLNQASSHIRKSSRQSSASSSSKAGKMSQGSFSSNNTNRSVVALDHLPTRSCLFDLYRSLSQGVTLKEWYEYHYHIIRSNKIDVRRFVIFGVIKKLIYRCYCYPVLKSQNTLELVKSFNGGISKYTDKVVGPKKSSKNIFSTSDIKFGAEEVDGKSSAKKSHISKLDMGDEALHNAYKKLSITERQENKPSAIKSISRLYRERSQLSLSDSSLHNFYKMKRSERPSKVSFDMKEEEGNLITNFSSQRDKNKCNEFTDSLEQINERNISLLESLRAVENIDRICVKLERSRSEVEELLQELGDYFLINT